MSDKDRLYEKVGIKWSYKDPTCPDDNYFCLLGISEDTSDKDVISGVKDAADEKIRTIKRYAHIDRKESGSSGLPKRIKDGVAKLGNKTSLTQHRSDIYYKRLKELENEAEALHASNALESTAEAYLETKAKDFGFHQGIRQQATIEAMDNVARQRGSWNTGTPPSPGPSPKPIPRQSSSPGPSPRPIPGPKPGSSPTYTPPPKAPGEPLPKGAWYALAAACIAAPFLAFASIILVGALCWFGLIVGIWLAKRKQNWKYFSWGIAIWILPAATGGIGEVVKANYFTYKPKKQYVKPAPTTKPVQPRTPAVIPPPAIQSGMQIKSMWYGKSYDYKKKHTSRYKLNEMPYGNGWCADVINANPSNDFGWRITVQDPYGSVIFDEMKPNGIKPKPGKNGGEYKFNKNWKLPNEDNAYLGKYKGTFLFTDNTTNKSITRTVEINIDYGDRQYVDLVKNTLTNNRVSLVDQSSTKSYKPTRITVRCKDRVITLEGQVSSREEYDLAKMVALLPPTNGSLGITKVINNLTIKAGTGTSSTGRISTSSRKVMSEQKWLWFTNWEVAIKPDGTFYSNNVYSGKYEIVGQQYILRWKDGNLVDTLRLLDNGMRLEGTNNEGVRVYATRIGTSQYKSQFELDSDAIASFDVTSFRSSFATYLDENLFYSDDIKSIEFDIHGRMLTSGKIEIGSQSQEVDIIAGRINGEILNYLWSNGNIIGAARVRRLRNMSIMHQISQSKKGHWQSELKVKGPKTEIDKSDPTVYSRLSKYLNDNVFMSQEFSHIEFSVRGSFITGGYIINSKSSDPDYKEPIYAGRIKDDTAWIVYEARAYINNLYMGDPILGCATVTLDNDGKISCSFPNKDDVIEYEIYSSGEKSNLRTSY